MEESKYIMKTKLSKFNIVISDEKESLLNDDNHIIWSYWFEGNGLDILNNFPFAELFNIGDSIDIYYAHILFNNKKYSRNFVEDWKTSKLKIKDKIFFYNNVDYVNGNEVIPEVCPEPTIFYEIELVY